MSITISVKNTVRVPRRSYKYFHKKTGKLIRVPRTVTTVHKFPNKYITKRRIDGKIRWVEITKRHGKVFVRILEDKQKTRSISYLEAKNRFRKLSELKREDLELRRKMYYFGTMVEGTFYVIKEQNTNDMLGICLNMYDFNDQTIKKLKLLEKMDMNLFMDNGSFERFSVLLKKQITPDEYFNYENSKEFFTEITSNYEKLFEKSKNPKRIILTVPEVIGSSDLTQRLQKEFLNEYKEMEKKYKCRIIIALQFNPKDKNWKEQLQQGAEFLKQNAPKTWLIGIPFGNDFKEIQNEKNFKEIENVFDSTLKGYKAHLFGCGSPTKLERFALNKDFVYSVDASSVMNWSKDSHYFDPNSGRVIDIRYLTGKKPNARSETIEKKRGEFERSAKMKYQKWISSPRKEPEESLSYFEKFSINLKNFTEHYKL